jgi:hypothetical protein
VLSFKLSLCLRQFCLECNATSIDLSSMLIASLVCCCFLLMLLERVTVEGKKR